MAIYTTRAAPNPLAKVTPGEGKSLAIDLVEKNGGWHLVLKVPNRKILKAVILPDNNGPRVDDTLEVPILGHGSTKTVVLFPFFFINETAEQHINHSKTVNHE